MLKITIPSSEFFDEKNQMFIITEEKTIELEHSLVSLSEWESKWNKPFLTDEEKSTEEIMDYIRMMTITKNIDPIIYTALSEENINSINEYIKAPMTATTFSDNKTGRKSREIITSELIYYWMVALTIPFECQYWHLNRLITLIKVCEIKNQPSKKMSKREVMSRNAALNASRKKQLNTTG